MNSDGKSFASLRQASKRSSSAEIRRNKATNINSNNKIKDR